MMKKLILLTFACLLSICCMAAKKPKGKDDVKKVAILETVDKKGNVSYTHKLMLRTSLTEAITAAPGYEGYDRTDLESVLGEQNFQRTGMVSAEQIKKLGEMTGAQYVLVAEAVMADASNIYASAKIIDVETAQTIKSKSQLMRATSQDIQYGCTLLASNLLGVKLEVGITHSAATTTAPIEPVQQVPASTSPKTIEKNGIRIYLSCAADIFGVNYANLKNDIRRELNKMGYTVVSDASQAEWNVNIEAFASEGKKADMAGMVTYLSYAEAQVSIDRTLTGERVYEDNIKEKAGEPDGYEQAAREAYKYLAPSISKVINEQIQQ